jgi:hypothetical protein
MLAQLIQDSESREQTIIQKLNTLTGADPADKAVQDFIEKLDAQAQLTEKLKLHRRRHQQRNH